MKRELLWVDNLVLHPEHAGRLNHLDISIGAGEALCIMGLSGSGKGALAEILCGEQTPDSGSVRQAGRSLCREELAALSVRISQDSRLLPNLSVTDNLVTLALGRDGFFCRERRLHALCRELLADFELSDTLDLPPAELSAAVQHRLLLIGAVIRQKQLVVLDHTADAYTPQEAQQLSACIRHLCGRGLTVVYLTGHPDMLLWEMDRVTVIRDGRRVKELPRGTFTESALRTYLYGYRAAGTVLTGRTVGETAFLLDGFPVREGQLLPVYDPGDTAQLFFSHLTQTQEGRHVRLLTSESSADSWIGSFSLLDNLMLAVSPRISGPLGHVSQRVQRMLLQECSRALGLTPAQIQQPFSDLSRMERFRAALYREHLLHTDLWLLNRVTAGADLQDRDRMRMAAEQLPGIVFYISGDYNELTSFGTGVLTLVNGRLREETP